jgi:GTPase
MTENAFRCGTVAILGRPNVGKSTLLNAMLGEPLSIMASKPQTTRHQILGIVNRPDGQMIMVDTPGLHAKAPRALNRRLNATAAAMATGVDCVLFVVAGTKLTADDSFALAKVKQANCPVILVINQIDRVTQKDELLPHINALKELHTFAQIVPISALKNISIDALEKAVFEYLPYGPAQFEVDQVTDRSERFLAAEYVREQLIRQLGEELPYATTVTIESFTQTEKLKRVSAIIWVEREGQKAIVIGDKGESLKRIGTGARKRMERVFDNKVFLELWVKVKAGWSDNEQLLTRFGYE